MENAKVEVVETILLQSVLTGLCDQLLLVKMSSVVWLLLRELLPQSAQTMFTSICWSHNPASSDFGRIVTSSSTYSVDWTRLWEVVQIILTQQSYKFPFRSTWGGGTKFSTTYFLEVLHLVCLLWGEAKKIGNSSSDLFYSENRGKPVGVLPLIFCLHVRIVYIPSFKRWKKLYNYSASQHSLCLLAAADRTVLPVLSACVWNLMMVLVSSLLLETRAVNQSSLCIHVLVSSMVSVLSDHSA